MIKKFFVIGNPIEHSFSPKLHNYWINQNNIKAIYDKKKLDIDNLENIILEIKDKKISGINVTVPFKKAVIPYLDKLSPDADQTQSVNTIILDNNNLGRTSFEGHKLATSAYVDTHRNDPLLSLLW